MSGTQVPSDWIIQFGKVISSSLASAPDGSPSRPVQFAVAGIADSDTLGDEEGVLLAGDSQGEQTDNADVFGQIGVVARPLPPSDSEAVSEHAEVICVRTSDGLVPIASRDVRLRMFGNAPNKGTVALIGYGGSYHSVAPVDNDDLTKGSIHTIYCPYDFDSDFVAQKAHVITIDPTSGNESISIVHADGQAIFLQSDGSVQLQSSDSPQGSGLKQSVIQVLPGQINLQTDQLVLNGGMTVIGNPMGAIVPLLPGVASPPCPRLFLNPA